MRRVPLSRGKYALVDDEDFQRVNEFKWYYNIGYAWRNIHVGHKTIGQVMLHRFVMNAKPGQTIDHINGDGLDCRKINLRFCTRRQNQQNSRKRRWMNGKPTTSKYKGVSWDKRSNGWVARIHDATGRYLFLGKFTKEEDAYIAYINAAKIHHGEFAHG